MDVWLIRYQSRPTEHDEGGEHSLLFQKESVARNFMREMKKDDNVLVASLFKMVDSKYEPPSISLS